LIVYVDFAATTSTIIIVSMINISVVAAAIKVSLNIVIYRIASKSAIIRVMRFETNCFKKCFLNSIV
jgi:hypothetical protein